MTTELSVHTLTVMHARQIGGVNILAVVAQFLQDVHFLLEPHIQLVAQLTAIHLEPCGQRCEFLHHDLETGDELQLVGHDVSDLCLLTAVAHLVTLGQRLVVILTHIRHLQGL